MWLPTECGSIANGNFFVSMNKCNFSKPPCGIRGVWAICAQPFQALPSLLLLLWPKSNCALPYLAGSCKLSTHASLQFPINNLGATCWISRPPRLPAVPVHWKLLFGQRRFCVPTLQFWPLLPPATLATLAHGTDSAAIMQTHSMEWHLPTWLLLQNYRWNFNRSSAPKSTDWVKSL